ncbi:hypothetical protein HMI01_11510 [Halolactibacillus miurensis]|uniref:histidine kinase n=1 Tax=Halolactibacillus miurensis TaxID=306541 RepID=A0A1I6SQ30_9BACI|nr:sensor histidine kinase [Halolactibacillus miurensis]GEM04163.1 hypothetical protein HMI01_11510 [Halolactibacillus miurensis]SFS79084.1 Histidine kinase-, DNA gyrase B-, and HSP90-like ATPase [Halolactibacillus miurensis]
MKKLSVKRQLLLYFVITLSFALGIIYIQYRSYQYSTELQQDQTEKTNDLNTINQQTQTILQQLEQYVEEPVEDNHEPLATNLDAFEVYIGQFNQRARDAIDVIPLRQYVSNMIRLTRQTIIHVDQAPVDIYNQTFREVEQRVQYIEEEIFRLLDKTLTQYQALAELEARRLEKFNTLVLTLVLLGIVVTLFVALNVSRRITVPLDALTTSAEALAEGDYYINNVDGGHTKELSVLADSFNLMRYNITEAMREMKEKARMRELLREMKLKSLQNQIQPHFLFNTLNVISRTAYLEEAKETDQLIHALSGLLRHNIGELDHLTTIEAEVASVRKYFQIQAARFGQRFSFQTFIDENCLDSNIPPLTLQPLVENAFIHGIEPLDEQGVIIVKVSREKKTMVIEVIDNGIGMDQVKVKRLLDTTQPIVDTKGHSTGLGMTNVKERLRHYYSDMRFDIQSKLNQGTHIKIILPMTRMEGDKR